MAEDMAETETVEDAAPEVVLGDSEFVNEGDDGDTDVQVDTGDITVNVVVTDDDGDDDDDDDDAEWRLGIEARIAALEIAQVTAPVVEEVETVEETALEDDAKDEKESSEDAVPEPRSARPHPLFRTR